MLVWVTDSFLSVVLGLNLKMYSCTSKFLPSSSLLTCVCPLGVQGVNWPIKVLWCFREVAQVWHRDALWASLLCPYPPNSHLSSHPLCTLPPILSYLPHRTPSLWVQLSYITISEQDCPRLRLEESCHRGFTVSQKVMWNLPHLLSSFRAWD